jgi:hypothetical protein
MGALGFPVKYAEIWHLLGRGDKTPKVAAPVRRCNLTAT